MNIGIVRSIFNEEITERMEKAAVKRAKELQHEVTHILRVPGSFDMPVAVQHLLEKSDVDGVATVGCIIQGSTDHDVVIATTTSQALVDLSLKYKKPVGLGVTGPRMNRQQANNRAEEYAKRSVEAVAKLVEELK